MNQNEFFNVLMDGLKDFPEIKLQDIISYYENNFRVGLASGKTEQEILRQLGDPNLIVNRYRNEDLKTPINSECLTSDADITPINDKNSITDIISDNNNSINNYPNSIDEPAIVTDNTYTDIFNDFNTNDNLNNNNNNKENDFETNNKLDTLKINDSYKDINLNSDFYNLDNSNESNFNYTDESGFNSNNDNNDYSNYNSKFNNNRSSDSNSSNFNDQISKNKTSQFNVNTLLKISIIILALIIFFPVITGIIGCILGLLGAAIGILLGSIGLLVGGTFTSFIGGPNVPMFVANFPYPVIVLFSLGSISLSIILSLIFYYLCKFFIHISVKSFKSLKSKGGAF
ncbi:hypothetical protein psyc5s11_51380 [Clostridium gelidum]|uniref:DUF1700 domain-containing protein n=1 Tax=Clostridium gelidum TaxID=704125 RepID=A0ABM7TAR7_9CLOT|nr:DUF1700 domain-containing protein [Clostridium gelidum]BCZ49071.1 hypothetical protein psyc5s11_51380 [Clostridium gelidum]